MEADEAAAGAAGLGSSVHAAEANAAAAAELGGAQQLDGFWEQVVDRLQVLTNSLGMSYDMDSTLGEKAGNVGGPAPA
jgi:hypothetical protein